MSGVRRDFGFSLITVRRGDEGGLVSVQRFQCVECGEVLDRTKPNTPTMNPEAASNWAKQRGWKAGPWKKNACYCPRCAGPQKKTNNPDSELKKVVQLPVQSVPREVTAEERQRIRNMLDKHFDDGVGMYLDGMSDQRIAELVNVSRIRVEQLREAAYGAIRVDPAVATMREEMVEMRKQIEAVAKQADTLMKQAAGLASRIEKLAAGIAA